jgi:3'(2'), 5'-bisphosphate nucleotidase
VPAPTNQELIDLWVEIANVTIPLVQRYRRRLDAIGITSKSDGTLLTDADTDVQDAIVSTIRSFDSTGVIIAEEGLRAGECGPGSSELAWIIDPIDGTSQFVRPDCDEFCSAIALSVDGLPTASLILAYELGEGRTPIRVEANVSERKVSVDGQILSTEQMASRESGWASMTRSKDAPTSDLEAAALRAGLKVKTTTTSQSIDLLRTSPVGRYLESGRTFEVFYRENQKIWDGVPGICLALASGLAVKTMYPSMPHLPMPLEFLQAAEPTFRSTLVGAPQRIRELTSDRTPSVPE